MLASGAGALGQPLDEGQLDALLLYFRELKKWNTAINLVARRMKDMQLLELHFLDSLSLAPFLGHGQPQALRLLDVGSGAGFPGLVLALVLPKTFFVLIEPRQKRATFLNHMVRCLKLSNTQIIASRLEEYDTEGRQEKFSHITSRALAEPQRLLELVQPFCQADTRVILMLAKNELPHVERVSGKDHQWNILRRHGFSLPFSGITRLLVELQLVKQPQAMILT